MARKSSIKLSARSFVAEAAKIEAFINAVSVDQTKEHVSWIYDFSIIRLYKEFEGLMLDALVGAVNNDTSTISQTTDVAFPKHLTDEVCEFLITGTGYFDFKGRSGLIKTLRSFVPENHYLVVIVKKKIYQESLERLTALRNFAAHESAVSKRAAKEAVNAQKLHSAGSWLKARGRFTLIASDLKKLAVEIENAAPF